MKKLIFTLLMVVMGFSAIFGQTPKRIAFLTDPTNGTPQYGIEAALRGEGYTVDISYTPFDTVALAAYDMILVSRGVSSSDFSSYQTWNRMTTPILILSAYAVRDTKMRFLNGQEVSPADSNLINPNMITNAVALPNKDGVTYDSVFNNVVKNGTQFPFYKGMYCYLDYYLSDFNLDANTGKPLVKINDTATDGAGSLIMVRWEPGVEAYAGTGILHGRRTYLDIGTDDNATPTHFNMDNYTPLSLTLFKNEVKHLLGFPIPKWVVTKVSALKNVDQFKLYPNPATNGKFVIEVKDAYAKSANVQIYTLTGQQVYSRNFNASESMNVNSGLANGMYLLVVNIDGNKTSQKIIIN
jgi:hypothetical protein